MLDLIYKQDLHAYEVACAELGIPQRMVAGIYYYVEVGRAPGDFLMAVLRNDLKEAVHRADDENIHKLHVYVRFFYLCAPAGCWGSPECVQKWLDEKEKQGETSV